MLGLILWPSIWSVLVNAPYTLGEKKSVFCHYISALYLSIRSRSRWLMVFFWPISSLILFFCLILSIPKRGMLKISNHDCGFVYFSSEFCQFCFMYFEVLLLRAYTFIIVMSSWWIFPFIMWNVMLLLVIDFNLKSALCVTSTDTLLSVCMVYLLLSLFFQHNCVFKFKVCLL